MTRILSLDDLTSILDLLNFVLVPAGYEHLCTTSSARALCLLRHEPPDLFTQDNLRPDVLGLDLYRRLKGEEQLRQIPVLFITAYKSEQLAAEVARHGDGYLTKPFSPQELLQAVQETLERRGKPLPSEEERARAYQKGRKALARTMRMEVELLDGHYRQRARQRGQTGDALILPAAAEARAHEVQVDGSGTWEGEYVYDPVPGFPPLESATFTLRLEQEPSGELRGTAHDHPPTGLPGEGRIQGRVRGETIKFTKELDAYYTVGAQGVRTLQEFVAEKYGEQELGEVPAPPVHYEGQFEGADLARGFWYIDAHAVRLPTQEKSLRFSSATGSWEMRRRP